MAEFYLPRLLPEEMEEAYAGLDKAHPNPTELFRDIFMGPDTPEQHKSNVEGFQMLMTKLPQLYCVKITEKSTRKIVAASMWSINMTVVPDPGFDRPRPWLNDDKEKLERVIRVMNSTISIRKKWYTKPHIQIMLFYTHPDFQRRGAGSMMMNWGCTLADHLYLPLWVEGSTEGRKLYEKFGCVLREANPDMGDFLEREARPLQIEGGTPAKVADSA
ncbi:hypothetical protein K461DRAFT_298156 [Myriangium duriaei CBS 260.36]|uniref:N-acetyltransferase domain-containing protein n=1 Tax=Myriangium duriaei CBS 260.36 TaxID=1168546 RepID=A0A9P4ITI2_9PEZI|nr:hypothetical protein K461DRAFT_298156 [Myriangium duriaei CBS 260.36]